MREIDAEKIFILVVSFVLVIFGFSAFHILKKAEAAGTTYYVDQVTGNDLDSGLTEDDAWATITKAANTLTAGDTVYIKNGTYREGLNFYTNSGTSGNPITFRNYPGHNPVINGSLEVTGWSLHAGSVYKATWDYTSIGCWEDTDLLLEDNGAVPDAAGEWYLDDPGNTLYVWPSDSAHPDTHTYEASTRTLGNAQGNVLGMDQDYLAFIGLKTIHADNDGININDSVELIFNDMTAEDNASDGYSQHTTSQATINNMTLNRNGKCNIANVDSSSVTIDGLTMNQGTYGPSAAASILFSTSSSADITNATIDQGSYKNNYAFYPLTSGNVNISDSTIIGGSTTGTINTQEHTTFDRVTIDGGGAGRLMRIAADSGDRVIVRNSVLKNMGSDGFFPITNGAKARIENSLVIGQSTGYAFWAYATDSEIEVYNTIVADNPLRTFHFSNNGTVTEDYNILWNSGGYTGGITPGVHTISDDPDFIDYVGGNYHLELTSPAIDSGISTYSSTTDGDAKQRYDHPDITDTGAGALTYYDRGPYEYVIPPDPIFISPSHSDQNREYFDTSVDMQLTSSTSSTTRYRYLVTQMPSPSQSSILAGTLDEDGIFTADIPGTGQWYIHILAVTLDNDPSENYFTYGVKIIALPESIPQVGANS